MRNYDWSAIEASKEVAKIAPRRYICYQYKPWQKEWLLTWDQVGHQLHVSEITNPEVTMILPKPTKHLRYILVNAGVRDYQKLFEVNLNQETQRLDIQLIRDSDRYRKTTPRITYRTLDRLT